MGTFEFTLFNALLPSLAPRAAVICAVRKPNDRKFELNLHRKSTLSFSREEIALRSSVLCHH